MIRRAPAIVGKTVVGAERVTVLSRRRLVSAAPLALALAPAIARAVLGRAPVSFQISRNGSVIGTHAVAFAGDPASTFTATADVKIGVHILGVRVFHYTHHMVEHWEGGRFVSLDATTDDDGEAVSTTVRRAGDTLNIAGTSGRHVAPGTALPATHWNKDELKNAMINPQNGRMIHAQIAGPSPESVTTTSGKTIAASHYTWRGDDSLDLFYAADGSWAGLTALAKDGSNLVYTRT
ncbi:MAG TPA: DUF6134 family protein [Rhizomicrobium sp.]|jgi:hypothetical protein|nr:DUF6134 family protein [Rhizomicrobium sp.]